jgi:hypothetical protein
VNSYSEVRDLTILDVGKGAVDERQEQEWKGVP